MFFLNVFYLVFIWYKDTPYMGFLMVIDTSLSEANRYGMEDQLIIAFLRF